MILTDQKLEIYPLRTDQLENILDFCSREQHGRPPYYQRSLIKRLLTQLSSFPANTLDIFNGNERIAVIGVVDKVDNPSHSANIEILGLDLKFQNSSFFEMIFERIESMPFLLKSVQVGFDPSLEFLEMDLKTRGYDLLYFTYTMKCDEIKVIESHLPPEFHFEKVTPSNFSDYYEILIKSFSKNLETSIPPMEEMKTNFDPNKSMAHILKSNFNGTVGFLNVAVDDDDLSSGEVRMIGTLPGLRNKGIGRILLSKSLELLRQNGCKKSHLTVAVGNMSALKLYKEFDFEVSEKFSTYFKTLGVVHD